mgnify:CR=1 FL=1
MLKTCILSYTSCLLTCSIFQIADGERLPLVVKELGTCDLYPQVSSYLLFKRMHHSHIDVFQ